MSCPLLLNGSKSSSRGGRLCCRVAWARTGADLECAWDTLLQGGKRQGAGAGGGAQSVLSATELITLKWLGLQFVHFILISFSTNKVLTVPGRKPRYTISLSTLQKSH